MPALGSRLLLFLRVVLYLMALGKCNEGELKDISLGEREKSIRC